MRILLYLDVCYIVETTEMHILLMKWCDQSFSSLQLQTDYVLAGSTVSWKNRQISSSCRICVPYSSPFWPASSSTHTSSRGAGEDISKVIYWKTYLRAEKLQDKCTQLDLTRANWCDFCALCVYVRSIWSCLPEFQCSVQWMCMNI